MIAVDCMGGDYAPRAVVTGSLSAARCGIPLILYGDQLQIEDILKHIEPQWKKLPLVIKHCHETITMDDEPTRNVLAKKGSSLTLALDAVACGVADAAVSAGNSGAALVAGILHLGKIPGILRPAIGGFFPTKKGSVFCIDLGANVDSKPEYLYQFALMGSAYVNVIKGITSPKIALLCNGAEPGKGTQLIKHAHELLVNAPVNFVGNVEPMDIFNDYADVVVCEGFSGNIMLKSIEATLNIVMQWLKEEGDRSMLGRALGLYARPVFRRLKRNIKKEQRGGALLVGVTKPLVIAHGSSDARAIEEAILFAHETVESNFTGRFNEALSKLLHMNQVPIAPQVQGMRGVDS